MFDNLTNHGMIDLMEKHFDKHIKSNFGSYIYVWRRWIRED